MQLHIQNGVLTGYSGNPMAGEIHIPDAVTKIEFYTFRGWTQLKQITLPETLQAIGYGAFESCESLERIHFPESLESIGHMCFLCCISLKRIHIPANVRHIGYGAFASCSALEEITVDEKNPYFTSIDGVLYNKEMTELYCCPAGKKQIAIPETVQTIRKFAFAGNRGLTEIRIPESVTKIQYGAFRWCIGLKEILLPVTVLQCENPDFLPETFVHVQGNSGVMTYQPCESFGETCAMLVLEKDFSVHMNHKIKYDLIFRMLFAGIPGTEEYVRKNFAKMFRFLIDQEETQKISEILNLQKFISKRNIQKFISYADEKQHSDCWEILYHYKEQHFS